MRLHRNGRQVKKPIKSASADDPPVSVLDANEIGGLAVSQPDGQVLEGLVISEV
jgi:hypothetical protein